MAASAGATWVEEPTSSQDLAGLAAGYVASRTCRIEGVSIRILMR